MKIARQIPAGAAPRLSLANVRGYAADAASPSVWIGVVPEPWHALSCRKRQRTCCCWQKQLAIQIICHQSQTRRELPSACIAAAA